MPLPLPSGRRSVHNIALHPRLDAPAEPDADADADADLNLEHSAIEVAQSGGETP
jgi:hypothetical protein